MSEPYGGWSITKQRHDPHSNPWISLEVNDIRELPNVVSHLVEWGHDLSATVQAIKDATEKQQQAKQAESLKEKRECTARAKAALDSSMRRFVIAYNHKSNADVVSTAQGTRFGDGSLNIETAAAWPIGGSISSEDAMKSIAERYGYEYHIEYMD